MGIEIAFKESFDKATAKISRVAKERVLEATYLVRDETHETLSGSRSGRTYKVPGTQKEYTASAPGEPPAVQLADLRKSVKAGLDETEIRDTVGYVGTDLPKGPMLEFGTTRMEARPWLRTSFEKSAAAVKALFMRIWF